MNSKECLYEILGMLNYEQMDVCEKHNYLKVISQDLDRLEKELKQTKLNFRNSQIHSKNCYKKLKKKYNNLKKALDILKRFHFQLNQTRHNSTGHEIWIDSLLETEELTKEEYELLKEVLSNDKQGNN